jgi:transposase-like protein
MVHRFFKIFPVDRGFRYSVAVNETVVKLHGLRACRRCRFREILAIYTSRGRNMLIALKFLRMVLY